MPGIPPRGGFAAWPGQRREKMQRGGSKAQGPFREQEIRRHAIAAVAQAIESLWKNLLVQLRDSFAPRATSHPDALAFRATRMILQPERVLS